MFQFPTDAAPETVPTIINLYLTIIFFSGNGTFVGVGTAEGDISVFISWNLSVSIFQFLANILRFQCCMLINYERSDC